jgi:hypothetical protein
MRQTLIPFYKRNNMRNNNQRNNNQSGVGLMIQKCHKYRQRRKQYMDQARQTADEIERERLMQMAEHYGRIVSCEQEKIDGVRGPAAPMPEPAETSDDDDDTFPDFINNL